MAQGGFEVKDSVLASGREVVDEAGFFEVIEGRSAGDGFLGLEMERECREAGETTDDGG